MERTVRLSKRVYRMHLLRSHVELYRTVLPSDETVVDRGNPAARVCVVPFRPEPLSERMGQVFWGREANLIAKLLDTAGLEQVDVWLTYLHKYATDYDYVTSAQQSAMNVLMKWELQALKPDVVVTMGADTNNMFDHTYDLVSGHGKPKRKSLYDGHTFTWLPTFAPHTGITSSVTRRAMYDDFKLLKMFLGRN